jgi:hypothetical protein
MKHGKGSVSRNILVAGGLLMLLGSPARIGAEPTPAAVAAFGSYAGAVEARIAQQHRSGSGFLAIADSARLRQGELVVEELTPASGKDLPGALLHHWRGTAFIGGAKSADFERTMKDFGGYPTIFSPQVLQARVITHDGDRFQVTMRVRQKHIITVVMDTAYDVTFGRGGSGEGDFGGPGAQGGFSISRSTHIAEIDSPGSKNEHALDPSAEHGFLWRQNIYWSYEERDGGLYVQIESVSLTRSIPVGLGWAIGPFVESIPKESLEFTLRAARDAVRK